MKKIIFLSIFFISALNLYAEKSLYFETGVVSVGYNDIQIPGNSGTKFSLSDSFSIESKMFYRIRFTSEIAIDKFISVLYAPLSLNASGITSNNIIYNNDTFSAGTNINAKYRFDSYRISYWKSYKKRENLFLKLGVTAKIRDASIKISSNDVVSEKKNTGFVPLINFGAEYLFNDKIQLILDADALAGGPGRAEDVFIAFSYKAIEKVKLILGYRFIEGGADTEEVYNFVLLNYLSFSIMMSF